MCQSFTQVFADFAFELGGSRHDIFQRTVFFQPFDRCFGADFIDTGDVIHGVANQREVIADAFGRDPEFFHYASRVGVMPAHGIDQVNTFIHQLRHVFVASGNNHLAVVVRR